jgi:hypothetical protein
MPDRIVRDELLESERYMSLASDSERVLFFHLVLTADDFGNAEATAWRLRRIVPNPAADVEALLAGLVAADLVRVYEAAGKRYIHIPRFRQRLRHTKCVHPRPPAEIDDLDLNEIKHLLPKTSDVRQPPVSRPSAEEKRREEKREEKDAANAADLWDFGIETLKASGLGERTARAFIGSLCKSHDDDTVLDAMRAASGKADPKAFALAFLKDKPKRGMAPKQKPATQIGRFV